MVNQRPIDELIRARCGGDFEAAHRAESEMRRLGQDALPELMSLLRRFDLPSLQMHWEAVLLLTNIGEAALPDLFAVLKNGDSGSRWTAGETIAYIGRPGVPGSMEALRHGDPEMKQIAAYVLTNVPDERAVPALIEAMRDGDAMVRLGAIKALRQIGDPSAELPLRSALVSGVTPRAALRWALNGVQEQAVLRMLDDLHQLNPDGENARAGIRRIWETEPGRLLHVLRKGRYVMRARAADALRLLRDPRAVPDLLRALDDDVDMVRGHAAIALGAIGDRRAVGPLLDMLREPDMLIRWTAAEALGQLGDPAAVLPLLEAWINADHEMILEVAGEAISRIGEAAHGPLREALDDPREEVQRAARYILGQLGAPQ